MPSTFIALLQQTMDENKLRTIRLLRADARALMAMLATIPLSSR